MTNLSLEIKNSLDITSRRSHLLPLSRTHILLLLIFLVALCLRVLNIFAFREGDPMFDRSIPMLDMFQFQRWILHIVDSHWVDAENVPFWQAPLYAYFMAFIVQIFGRNLLWVKLVQALIGSLNCLLIYLVGKKTFNVRVGLIAAFLGCFYGMFFLYEATLLRESFLAFIFLLSIFAFLLARERKHLRWWVVAGVCLGLDVIGRENLLLFIPVALLWGWKYCGRDSLKKKSAVLGAILAGTIATIAPVTAKNYLVGHELVLVSKGGGFNFYMGNCREANGTLSITPSIMRIAPNLHSMSSKEFTAIDWFGLTFKEIGEEPSHFAWLLFRKLYLYWASYEIPNNVNYYLSKRFSWVLRLPLIPYWLILPFAVTGILLSLRERPNALLLQLFLFSYMASILLVYVVARYRVPTVPCLLIFAGYCIDWWVEKIRSRDVKKLAVSLIPFLVAAVFSFLSRSEYIRPNDFFNVALAYQSRGNFQQAAADYENALNADPNFAPARKNLIACSFVMNQPEKALRIAREGVRNDPQNAESFYDFARVLEAVGRTVEAEENLEHALVLDPAHAAAREKLSELYELSGRISAAEAERKKLLEETNGTRMEKIRTN